MNLHRHLHLRLNSNSNTNSYYQAPSGDAPSSSDRTYTQQSAFSQPARQEPQGKASEPTNPFEVNAPPQLKPFRPNQQSAKGSWQVNEPRRRTSFKAMFASFLAGVLVVGTLMYTADTQNWFSGNAAATTTSQQTASGTAANGTAAQGNGGASVTAARPDNIASLFETASPAVVKIETYVKPAALAAAAAAVFWMTLSSASSSVNRLHRHSSRKNRIVQICKQAESEQASSSNPTVIY